MTSNPVAFVALLVVGFAFAALLLVLFRRRAGAAMVAWTLALFFVPQFIGVQAGVFVTVLTAITVLCILSCWNSGVRWSLIDGVAAALLAMMLLGLAIGGGVWGHVEEGLLMWFLPYVWGRLALGRMSWQCIAQCLAVAGVLAAALAIVEYATATNLFLSLPGAQGWSWYGLQIRADRVRAEGAFGHSIALGGSLALSSAFILVVRWPVWVRLAALTILGVGVLVTFSRIGLVGLVLTVVLAVALLGRWLTVRFRLLTLGLLAVGALVGLPIIFEVFGEAGSEASGSAEYRVDLISLLNEMSVLGVSPAREVTATGQDYFGGFRSIDSGLILIALRHGILPALAIVALLVVLIISVLRGRATPAGVAVAAQVPAFLTVALITQYSALVWFLAGLAVTWYSTMPRRFGRARRGTLAGRSSRFETAVLSARSG